MKVEGAVAEKLDQTMDLTMIPRKSAENSPSAPAPAAQASIEERVGALQDKINEIRKTTQELNPWSQTRTPENLDRIPSAADTSALPPIAPYVHTTTSAPVSPKVMDNLPFESAENTTKTGDTIMAAAETRAHQERNEFLGTRTQQLHKITPTVGGIKPTAPAPQKSQPAKPQAAVRPAPKAKPAAKKGFFWSKKDTSRIAPKPLISTTATTAAPKPIASKIPTNSNSPSAAPLSATTAKPTAPRPVAPAPKASVPATVPAIRPVQKKAASKSLRLSGWDDVGTLATGTWLTGSVLYLGGVVGWNNLADLPAHQLGAIVAGVSAPLALIWMGIQYVRRHEDIKKQIAPLVKQVDQLLNPTKQVYPGITSAADSLRLQANELINAASQVERTLSQVREGLRADMQQMMENAGLTGKHLEQAFIAMSSRTTQLARLTEQMHGRLLSFEEHAKNGSDRLDQSVSDMMNKAQGASDRLEKQTNNIVAALHAANMRIQRTADDLDSRIGQIANFADQTAVRFGSVASEFGKQGAVVDAATQNIETQMLRVNQTFSTQLTEMAQAIQAFAGIGDELSSAVLEFRKTARETVTESSQQMQGLVHALEKRLQDAQAMLDRTAGVTIAKVGGIDRTVEKQLTELQASLRASADETPKLIKSILDDTTQKLLQMDMRFTGAGSQVTDQLQQLEGRISGSLQAMTNLAERISNDTGTNMKTAMVSVFSELQDMNDEFSIRAATTTRDLAGFHNELSQTIESLAQVARRATDRTVERILTLNSSIGQRILDLRDTASQAQEQGQKLEHTLVQHVGMLREANDQMTQHAARIETRGSEIVRNLMDASGTAMAQTELLSHIIGREADNLRAAAITAAGKLDDSGAALEMARSEIYASIASAAGQMNDAVREIEHQRALTDVSRIESTETQAALYQEILRLRDLTIELNQNINNTLLASDGRAKELQQLTTRLGEVTLGVKAVIKGGKDALTEAVGVMETTAQTTHESLNAQVQHLSDAARKIVLDSDQVVGTLFTQQNAMVQTATEGAFAIENLNRKLQQTTATVGLSAETTARDLDWLCNRIEDAGRAISAVSGRSEDAIQSARAAIVLSEASLQRSASSARITLSELSQRYNAEAGRVEDSNDVVSKSFGSAINRLEKLGHDLAEQTFNTFDSMTELGSLFDKRITQIRSGGEVATDQIQNVVGLLQHNFEMLTQMTTSTATQLQDINQGLERTQTDVGVTSDHARSRVEAVRRELGIYAQDLMMMVSQATGQMDVAAQGFTKRAEAMREAANENASQIGTLGHIVREEVNQLANTVQQVTEQQSAGLSHAVRQLRTQAEQLMQAAVQSMQNLEQQGTRSMQRVATLQTGVDQIGKQLDRTFEVLQTKGLNVQQSAEILGQQVEKASATMGNQSTAIQATADRVTAAIAEAGKKLAGQIESFDASGNAMRDRIEALSNNIAQQAGTLQRATEQAEETANKLSQSEIRLRRDAFMNAAKYLVESLNSLAIDLTRVLDPAEADRVWKEFNKGDSSAFTRRFLQMRDEVAAKRLREKFETDYEFRTYVQRYFRQFEELYEQAQRNDHHDMLATTITTSDVGKLYTYLAGAFGHARLRAANAA